jgi:phosphoribosylamine--glycine ligase
VVDSPVDRAYRSRMRVLVIGGGGREHALVWKLKQSPLVEKIWCAPGNGGIEADAECVPVDVGDVAALVQWAERLGPDLTVVGPELPLVNGIGDAFAERGWAIVAPSGKAAQLEGSKVFAKTFLERHSIPSAKQYGTFESYEAARAALDGVKWPVVIKGDGLCAGKGVLVASDRPEAEEFLKQLMERGEQGEGGRRVLLEEALEGQELSFIILADGERYVSFVPTRDHKRALDGNLGPNTGGMGAYSSDELLLPELLQTVLATVVEPTISRLRKDEVLYKGFLYFGLMLTKTGPKVLEFNCRLGDPEAQAIIARMDFDLAEVLMAAATGRLDSTKMKWKDGASVCVVVASEGYPGKIKAGRKIAGLTNTVRNNGVAVFHAGTRRIGDEILTSGGRVLGVTAAGRSVESAARLAYEVVQQIHFEGMQYRRDIAGGANRASAVGD